jgi:hypothetical protein
MSEYTVGQVLYLIGERTTKIMPIQVVEEVVITTLDGKQKTYTVKLPDKKESKVDISEIKGALFETTETLRVYMLKNATQAIDKMINSAETLCNAAFELRTQEKSAVVTEDVQKTLQDTFGKNNSSPQPVQHHESDDTIKIDLGDGKVATMKADELRALEQ